MTLSKKFTPATDNIFFYDSEFTSLDPYTGELLSVGMILPDNRELYLEIEPKGEVSAWDQEHVIPYLSGAYITREEARTRIADFLGDTHPHPVCFVPQYDLLFLHKLFGVKDGEQEGIPYHWMPVDFASILFSAGINPKRYSDEDPELFASFGIEAAQYRKHNALDDAKKLKAAYEAFMKK